MSQSVNRHLVQEFAQITTDVKVMKSKETKGCVPSYTSEQCAGADLYSRENVAIPAHTSAKIGTGVCVEIPNWCFGGLFARSGLATKKGLRPANCVGVIDSDYRGEIIVPLYNDSSDTQMIYAGDRIAQLIIMPYIKANFIECAELSETERGEGGFGSTGER